MAVKDIPILDFSPLRHSSPLCVTSVTRSRATAAKTLELVRHHWGAIENGLHHVRDTTLDEDRCTIFRGDAPENLATLRNLALNWLRRTGVVKITVVFLCGLCASA